LKARIFWYQIKEIKIKLILHNLTKAIQAIMVVVVVEEFNKAQFRIMDLSGGDNSIYSFNS
ncbi:MAG TPA: hypothetical protein ENN52_00925, partial [Methanofollis liminatans]|nr:hypothetical protein [Methanofollis liminatans]